MTYKWMRYVAKLVVAAGAMLAIRCEARAPDCPLARQPYSLATPLIDLLIDPRSHALLDQHAPWLAKQPAIFTRTTSPSFSAIVTLPMLATILERSVDDQAGLEKALSALLITQDAAEARCARYDEKAPTLVVPAGHPAILVFEKINGFRDGPSVDAAHRALVAMGTRNGWSLTFTSNGAAFTARQLRRFDAVVWNNISGDALTIPQRRAFRRYIEQGGGFSGIHGSGGDPVWWWDWYVDQLIGARFMGHPDSPQFQEARVLLDDAAAPLTRGIDPEWRMTEEWYSFASDPRNQGAHILARLDESSYYPLFHGRSLQMGGDHPIAWTRCVGRGRSFYTAIGHRPESYSEPHSIAVLERGIAWSAGLGGLSCNGDRGAKAP